MGYLLSCRKSPIKTTRRWTLNNADDNIHGQQVNDYYTLI